MEEKILRLEKENEELKKIIAMTINCLGRIAEQTSFAAVVQVNEVVEYFNSRC